MLTEIICLVLEAKGPPSDCVLIGLVFNQDAPSLVVAMIVTLPISGPQLVNVTSALPGCPYIIVIESEARSGSIHGGVQLHEIAMGVSASAP